MDGANASIETGGRVKLSAILSVTLVIVVISLHLYIRFRRRHLADYGSTITVLRPTADAPTASIGGLKASAIAALPTFIFRYGASDCAICLSAAEEGEVMRVLPGCRHVFHAGCIDMWLHSHSTCPVCRGEARPAAEAKTDQFGGLLAAPRLAERAGGGVGGGWRAMGIAGSGRWADGGRNQDLERQ